jgi:hypothetical protein
MRSLLAASLMAFYMVLYTCTANPAMSPELKESTALQDVEPYEESVQVDSYTPRSLRLMSKPKERMQNKGKKGKKEWGWGGYGGWGPWGYRWGPWGLGWGGYWGW